MGLLDAYDAFQALTVRNMFRSFLPASIPDRSRHLLTRAAFFGAGLLLLWLAIYLMPSSAPAAPPPDSTAATSSTASDGFHLFSPGNLIALALLAGGGVWALYLRRRSDRGTTSPSPIQLLGQMQLAPDQQLRLITCGDDVLLLGITSQQINVLQRYARSEFKASSPDAAAPQASSSLPTSSFASLLQQHTGFSVNAQSANTLC